MILCPFLCPSSLISVQLLSPHLSPVMSHCPAFALISVVPIYRSLSPP